MLTPTFCSHSQLQFTPPPPPPPDSAPPPPTHLHPVRRPAVGGRDSAGCISITIHNFRLKCWLKMDAVTSAIQTKAPEKNPSQWEFSCDLEVDYKSEEKARIIYSALAVDKELQPDKVRRVMSVSDGKLSVQFEATEARFLRASYSAFVDVLTLATETIEQFGKSMES